VSSFARRIQIRAWKQVKAPWDYEPLRLGKLAKDGRMVPAKWPLHPSMFLKETSDVVS
jgi:hypothetical protein